jgi:hypothetical protein
MGGFAQLAGLTQDVETGADPGNEALAALSASQPSAAPAPAAAAAPAGPGADPGSIAYSSQPAAAPGGGYDPLAGIGQLLSTLNQLPSTQQQPAGSAVTQRHGGLLTGLAGVLIDGLASGMAPTAREAYEMPMKMQQMRMQQQQMQLEQQKMQMEMAIEPIREKAMMAQSAINIMQAAHGMRELNKEHQMDLMGVQGKYTEQAIEEGRARLDATAPDLAGAQARTQELMAKNKDKFLNFGYYPTKWDDQANPTEYGIYESYPKGTLQAPFHYVLKGDADLGIKDEPIDIPAGTNEAEARLLTTTRANEFTQAKGIAQLKFAAAKEQATEEFRAKTEAFREKTEAARESERDRQFALMLQLKGPVPEGQSFGQPVFVNPGGAPMTVQQRDAKEKTFTKDYVEQLDKLQTTVDEFQRINTDPKQTGAERVTAMLNAVAISMQPLKGMARMSYPVLEEHEQARGVIEDLKAKWQKLVAGGGPVTPKQISDYTRVATGVVHDAYLRAAQESLREGLPVDFLPKPSRQGQVADPLTASIYRDVARGNNQLAYQEMQAAGWR